MAAALEKVAAALEKVAAALEKVAAALEKVAAALEKVAAALEKAVWVTSSKKLDAILEKIAVGQYRGRIRTCSLYSYKFKETC